MFRVTGPVTSRRSACRGEATKWMPKRSESYTGLVRPVISTSQPLHEPASTSRIARARPSRRRVCAARVRVRTRVSSPGLRGSVASPTFRILEKSSTSAPGPLAPQLAQHRLAADELIVEDASRHLEKVADERVADRVPDTRAALAGGHDALRPQHRQLLRDRGLIQAERLLQLLNAPVARDER